MANVIDVTYQSTGKSLDVDKLGMREMQRKAFQKRNEKYILIKAPPASGKSRALMFIGLDKITAKTSNINIPLGKKKKFGYLEIHPRKCALSNTENEKVVVAYIQVKDLSNKTDDKVFVFNGRTFSSSVTLRTFDHPVYDIWLVSCY